MKKRIWKHRRKCDFYRIMEIVSGISMAYGGLQIAAVWEQATVVPEMGMDAIILETMLGAAIVGLGWTVRSICKEIRVEETKYWKEDERRVLRKVG